MQIKTPSQVVETTLAIGQAKASLPFMRLFILGMLAGAFVALGGTLSTMCGYGFPEASVGNPALQKLLSGITFPIGLILVVGVGAELFTGNNATLIPSLMKGTVSLKDVLYNWVVVWIANFVGALLFIVILVWGTGILDVEPYSSALAKVATTKTSLPWMTVMLRGIGANWCVCLAVWLALAGHSMMDKAIGCWFPVMAFVVLGYEHAIANMFFIPAGMLAGADVSISTMFTANLIPSTIGNILGGALFVGFVYGWLYLKPSGKTEK